MRTGKRKLLIGAAALAILGFVLYRSRNSLHFGEFSPSKLWAHIRSANALYLLLGVAIIYGCFALRALRWRVFQGNIGKAEFWPIYRLTLAGFAAILALGRAGEPVRPLLLSRKANIPIANMFGIYVLERLFDIVCTAVIASVGLLLYSPHEPVGPYSAVIQKGARTGGAVMAAGVMGVIAFLTYLRFHGSGVAERTLEGWSSRQGWRSSVAKIVLGFVRGIQTIRSWRDLIQSVFISGIHWFLIALVYLLVCHAFGGKLGQLSFRDTLLLQSISLVGSVLQLPAVGGGQQALAFFAFVQVFGIEQEAATAAAIVIWLVTFASCGIAGIPLLIHEGFSFGQLKEMAEHEKEELAEEATRGKVK
jgi:glycosyltransferase 2 family protein